MAITPLLQMLRGAYPHARLTYFGGTRTEELWEDERLIDRGIPFQGRPLRDSLEEALSSGPFDLVINLEACESCVALAAAISGPQTQVVGHVLDSEGRHRLAFDDDERGRLWQDPAWTAADLLERYTFLDSRFIGTIFCRLCYLTGPIPGYRVASCPAPVPAFDVLISTAASLQEKLWPTEKWIEVIETLTLQGLSIGVVGAARSTQNRYWQGGETEETLIADLGVSDLRGKLSLPQVVHALETAKSVLTIDNGVLHLSAATKTPTVGLFRAGIARLWAPPIPTITALIPPDGCPVSEISSRAVLEAIAL